MVLAVALMLIIESRFLAHVRIGLCRRGHWLAHFFACSSYYTSGVNPASIRNSMQILILWVIVDQQDRGIHAMRNAARLLIEPVWPGQYSLWKQVWHGWLIGLIGSLPSQMLLLQLHLPQEVWLPLLHIKVMRLIGVSWIRACELSEVMVLMHSLPGFELFHLGKASPSVIERKTVDLSWGLFHGERLLHLVELVCFQVLHFLDYLKRWSLSGKSSWVSILGFEAELLQNIFFKGIFNL